MEQEQQAIPRCAEGREGGGEEQRHPDKDWRSETDKEWFRTPSTSSSADNEGGVPVPQPPGDQHPSQEIDMETDDDKARDTYWAECRQNFYEEGKYDMELCLECRRFLFADERSHGICKACQDQVAIDLMIHQRRGRDGLDAILIEQLNELAEYKI